MKESISYFKTAITKQTWENPNPYSGECYFNLGLALEADGQTEKAYDAFFKSTWSAETQSSGFYWLACLASRKRDLKEALDFIEKSLIRNWHNMKARNLKATLLRKLKMDSLNLLEESLHIDPLYMGCLYEKALIENDLKNWKKKMRPDSHNYLELALDYIKGGFYEDAIKILKSCETENPLCQYYLGYVHHMNGCESEAKHYYANGELMPADYCFPNRIEEIRILEIGIQILDFPPMAHYYLGNLLYDKKQYQEAALHWRESTSQKSDFAMAHRNLSIFYYNKEENPQKALASIKTACELDSAYPRFWLEYDQLAARLNVTTSERLLLMESHLPLMQSRDDLYLRYITLLNCTKRYEDALKALKNHTFHPWEGGEGKVSTQYRYALIQLAKIALKKQNPEKALTLLTASLSYPDNLGEGKLPNVPDNEAYYYMGLAFIQMNNEEKANEYFELAAWGPQKPSSVLYYNDQPSDFIYFQGLAKQKLGKDAAAKKSFHQLIMYGEKHLFDQVSYDFFAVSLPEIEIYQDNLQTRNTKYCNYLRALGYLGLNQKEKALQLIDCILAEQADYQGVLSLQRELSA